MTRLDEISRVIGNIEAEVRNLSTSLADVRLTTAEQEVTGGNSGGIRFFADGSSTGGHISVLMDRREWRINVAWLTGDIALEEHPE